MAFFKKKDKTEIPLPQKTEPEKTPSEPEPLPSIQEQSTTQSDTLSPQLIAKIEKLSAESEANSEIRSIYDERFTRIDEQIGEIREMMVDREKDIEELEVKAVKASDLVEEVQPQKILTEVKRNDLKIDSVKAKLETFESVNDTIMSELKKIRQTVDIFRGVEEVVELNKDTRQELLNFQKVKIEVERHADKVESLYAEVSKKFDDYKKYRDEAKGFEEQFQNIERQFNEAKIKLGNVVTKDDILKISKELEAQKNELAQKERYFDQIISKAAQIENELENIKNKQQNQTIDVKAIQAATQKPGLDNEFIIKIKNNFDIQKNQIDELRNDLEEIKNQNTQKNEEIPKPERTQQPIDTSEFVKRHELETKTAILEARIINLSKLIPESTATHSRIDTQKPKQDDQKYEKLTQKIDSTAFHNAKKTEEISKKIEAQKEAFQNALIKIKSDMEIQKNRNNQITLMTDFQSKTIKDLKNEFFEIKKDIKQMLDNISPNAKTTTHEDIDKIKSATLTLIRQLSAQKELSKQQNYILEDKIKNLNETITKQAKDEIKTIQDEINKNQDIFVNKLNNDLTNFFNQIQQQQEESIQKMQSENELIKNQMNEIIQKINQNQEKQAAPAQSGINEEQIESKLQNLEQRMNAEIKQKLNALFKYMETTQKEPGEPMNDDQVASQIRNLEQKYANISEVISKLVILVNRITEQNR